MKYGKVHKFPSTLIKIFHYISLSELNKISDISGRYEFAQEIVNRSATKFPHQYTSPLSLKEAYPIFTPSVAID